MISYTYDTPYDDERFHYAECRAEWMHEKASRYCKTFSKLIFDPVYALEMAKATAVMVWSCGEESAFLEEHDLDETDALCFLGHNDPTSDVYGKHIIEAFDKFNEGDPE